MSQPQSNPYEPPRHVDPATKKSSFVRRVGRMCVLVYGALFCVAGTIDDIWSRQPILETAFWFVMSVLTCYGVFALAIRTLRIPRLAAFWNYFGFLLPLLTYVGAGWEIYTQPALTPLELVVVLAMFFVVTTPGLIFNWMLRHRMDRTERYYVE